MDNKFGRRLMLTVIIMLVSVFEVTNLFQAGQQAGNPLPPALEKTFDKSPTGFTFKYPESWDYTIPMQGLLMAGAPETLFDNEPGPTLTVQRGAPLSIPGSLDNALDSYLEFGPMRVKGRWNITGEIRTITFDGRDARMVELEGADKENSPLTHVRIIATAADNTFVYMIITTIPVDLRPLEEPVLEAVLATVHILE